MQKLVGIHREEWPCASAGRSRERRPIVQSSGMPARLTPSDAPLRIGAPDVERSEILRLRAAHEAVAQLQIIDCMLRKQVPPKVFVVARIFLRWVRAGVTNVPNMAWKSMAIHGPADGAVPTISHGWHDLAIKPANAFQLFARDRNTGEREAALVLYPCMQRRRNNRIIIATLDYAKS